MKTKIFLMLILISSFVSIKAFAYELRVVNHLGRLVTYRIFPVSMVFNYDYNGQPTNPNKSYNLISRSKQPENPEIDFINGANAEARFFYVDNLIDEFDIDGIGGGARSDRGILGFGRYRMEVWFYQINPEEETNLPDESFTIEFDNSHGVPPYSADIDIIVELFNNSPSVIYKWDDLMQQEIELPANKKLEGWHQVNPTYWRVKDYGNFKYNLGYEQSNPYSWIPQDPRIDCLGSYISNQNQTIQNQKFDLNDIGILTLNLTIEKDIHTPTDPPYIANQPPPIIIEGDPTTQTGATLTIGSPYTLTFQPYSSGNMGTSLYVEPYGQLQVTGGVYPPYTHGSVIFNNYCNSEFEAHSILNLWPNSVIEMHGNSQMTWYPSSQIHFSRGSHIDAYDNTNIYNCGATVYGVVKINLYNSAHYFPNAICGQLQTYITSVDSSGSISLNNNSVLELGDNVTLVFDGSDSYLEANPGTTVTLGSNASIQFINGAYIKANGCTFTGSGWNGLSFTDIGDSVSITNCTFTGAANAIDISNSSSVAGHKIVLSGNTFNNGAVTIANTTNLHVIGNNFNCGSLVGDLLDVTNDLSLTFTTPVLNINSNTFIGGTNAQIRLDCYAGTVMPFYITYNHFAGSNPTSGLYAYNISGDLKYNTFDNDNFSSAAILLSSNLNFFGNLLKSTISNNASVWQNSTLCMAPLVSMSGNYYWYGGFNSLYLSNTTTDKNYSNVNFSQGSSFYPDLGENCFNINDLPYKEHIYGVLPDPCYMINDYYATQNYWNIPPVVNVYCGQNTINRVTKPGSDNCQSYTSLTPVDYILTNKGDGLVDSVIISSGIGYIGGGGKASNSIVVSGGEDKTLYSEIIQNYKQGNYSVSLTKSKQLIDAYDTSKFILSSLDVLYLTYEHMDTSHNQNTTIALFTELNTYLSQKMTAYANDQSFVEKAYDYYLMCLVKERQFTEAIAGYENIMENHPDPQRRLTASWDRAAVVVLMNTGGGGISNVNAPSPSGRDVRRLPDKVGLLMANKDPHKLAKEMYTKQTKELSDASSKTPQYSKEDKLEFLKRTVKFNPVNSKQLREKIRNDVKLVMNAQKTTSKSGKPEDNLPKVYKLHQNYPNPFNPATTIKYDLPKDGMVTIKIYDLLGRVVFSVEDYKKAGYYDFSFNGSNFASGIYFYKLEAGSFVDSKKTVLIK